ncbi:hypothetical protein [Streptomyces sp. NPDC048419]|uniref:hypothetical protein n=1 Tax=Streptomyces sp. NPDC048419 TaxID=3365547 RepID=UPI003716703E
MMLSDFLPVVLWPLTVGLLLIAAQPLKRCTGHRAGRRPAAARPVLAAARGRPPRPGPVCCRRPDSLAWRLRRVIARSLPLTARRERRSHRPPRAHGPRLRP